MTGFGLKDETSYKNGSKLNKVKMCIAASLLRISATVEKLCVFCNGKHESTKCFKAQRMSYSEKIKILKDKGDNLGTIDVLMGADVAGRLFTGKRRVLSSGLEALESYLEWTIMGKTNLPSEKEDTAMMVISMFVREDFPIFRRLFPILLV
ncbi:hypothetical protein AVEN_12199-1 [Araneus ventricosus]|uniref:Peptidase aspartic putative domain-containing protein n=1 Tax=Araneus ventricosus TaxID=182803 RepID=A0A4Y2T840_ARAVE|nr:hypothetical protein AVEN_12199-1 [Araneus ventricosus]